MKKAVGEKPRPSSKEKPTEISANPNEDNIKFFVDSKWTTNDIIKFYTSIQNLYDYYSYVMVLQHGVKEVNFNSKLALALVYSKIFQTNTILVTFPNQVHTFHKTSNTEKREIVEPLRINKISFSSPGFYDLIGVGSIVGHIKDTLFKIIDTYQLKNKKKLEEQRMEIENEILSIERNKKIIEVYKGLGFNNEQILQILYYERKNFLPLQSLIEENKLKSIS